GATTASLDQNRKVRDRFLASLSRNGHAPENAQQVSGGQLLSGVPFEVVDDFLRDFENHPDSVLSATDPIRRYISARRDDETSEWDVLIASLKSLDDADPLEIGAWNI